MVRHTCNNNPGVILCVSMIGIQMVYKSCCCRSYSCWLCYVIQPTINLDLRRNTLLITVYLLYKMLFSIIKVTIARCIHAFWTLQKHLTESITGRFLENCLIEVCLLYLSVSCCTGTEPKHSVSNGVLQHQTFLMFLMVFDKVGFCPHIYLSYTLMN